MLKQNSKFKIQKLKLEFKSFYFLIVLLIFAFCLLPFENTNAQTPSQNPKGITVIPSITELDLAKDPSEYELKYINNTNYDITLLLSAQDFTELEDGYKINYLEGNDAKNYKYSLSSWISFENKNLELLPGEEKTVKIFVDNDRLAPGGHYASILAKVDQINSNKAINVNPVISSLLFVRASTGNEIESGKISSLKADRRFLEFPKKFALRFQNNGNVFVLPRGTLTIYDPLGRKVSKSILNEGSLNTLPESIRRYDIELKERPKILLPGLYKASVNMNYGQSKQKINREFKFFSWGSFNFIKIAIILIPLTALIYYIWRKRK